MKKSAWLPVLAVAAVTGCLEVTDPGQKIWHSFSFESGLEGWEAAATDVDFEGGELEWSIERSLERATHGQSSLRFRLNNLNNEGKIWITREESVRPFGKYRVRISFDLASADPGNGSPFVIMAGAFPVAPTTAAALQAAFRDQTSNGTSGDSGYRWLEKSYETEVQAGEDGELHFVVGFWGTSIADRAYYIDDLRVSYEAL
jgi:hypothetical protein